jgi:hypothetical protein
LLRRESEGLIEKKPKERMAEPLFIGVDGSGTRRGGRLCNGGRRWLGASRTRRHAILLASRMHPAPEEV